MRADRKPEATNLLKVSAQKCKLQEGEEQMGEKSEKKQDATDIEAQVTVGLEEALFGDLEECLLADDQQVVIPAPAKPKRKTRPVKPKNYDAVWRETAAENIDAAADTLAAIKADERQKWLGRLIDAIEKRLGPEALGHMSALIQDRRKTRKGTIAHDGKKTKKPGT
jgi:hypothetical protein